MNPLVSIIMPVYNAGRYVSQAIESVLNQSYSNWELLIVNDGSTDNSETVIRNLSDNRISYFKQSNKGVSSARNVGLANMRGEFLCFLDADDQLPINSIRYRIDLFNENPAVSFIDGTVEVYEKLMEKKSTVWIPSFKGYPLEQLLVLSEKCFFALTWMIRINPELVYKFPEDMTHGEDLFFFISISEKGKYDFIDKPIYQYRKSPGSAMKNTDALGIGYTELYSKIRKQFSHAQSFRQRSYLLYRIRRIMFLTYLSEKKVIQAFKYALTGRI